MSLLCVWGGGGDLWSFGVLFAQAYNFMKFEHIIFCATEIFECEKIKIRSYDMFEDTKWSNQ